MSPYNVCNCKLLTNACSIDQTHQQNQTINLSSLSTDYNHDIFKCLPWQNSFYEHFLVNAWLWIDLSIFSVIPFVSMSFCSIVIIVNLMRLNQSYTNRLALNANPFTKHI